MVDLNVSDGVALIEMGLPKVNAFSPALCGALDAAMARAEQDTAVGAIVLASAVPRVFSAGLDLKALGGLGQRELEAFATRYFGLIRRIHGGPLPVVAAVEGHAIAGGALLLCAAARRVIAEGEYRIGLTEVTLGLPLPAGVAELVQWVLGPRAAAEVLCFGDLYDPGRALELGFADRLVPAGTALDEALAEARRFAALPRAALQGVRRDLTGPLRERLVALEQRGVAEFTASWFGPECSAARVKMLQRLSGK